MWKGLGTQADTLPLRHFGWSGLEGGFDGGDDRGIVGEDFGGEARGYVAVAVDEELFEVPKDAGLRVGDGSIVLAFEEAVEVFAEAVAGVADGFRLGGDEGPVESMGVGAGDGDLGEDGEVDGVVRGAEGL